MDAAGRVFEDWEFRVLESEAGIEEEESEGKIEGKERGNDEEKEKEISCQKHAVNSAQVSQGCQIRRQHFQRISHLQAGSTGLVRSVSPTTDSL